jgi:nucleoside-diphosphate-sugar epimerase
VSALIVTGASGFIGRHVLEALSGAPFDVVAVARRRRTDIAPAVEWAALDLLQEGAADDLFARVKPHALLHLAWGAGSATYRTDEINQRWAEASRALAHGFYAHGGRRAVFAGTSAEYQNAEARSLYAECKIEAVESMRSLAHASGGSFAWGRIFLPYGPHDAPHRLVPSVIGALLAGRTAHCSPGDQIRDFIHVRDVADALVDLMRGEREGPHDVGTGIGSTVRHVAESIGGLTGRPDLLTFDGPPVGGDEPHSLVAGSDLAATFGRHARTLETGLRETIAWHRSRVAA